jgi:ubiquinone/menaquinone biosynthesis C-methylase UbiE
VQSGSVDAVTITLVLHECSDSGKRAILAEAFRIMRPGGTIVLSDTPQDDLGVFRGFFEPHKEASHISNLSRTRLRAHQPPEISI